MSSVQNKHFLPQLLRQRLPGTEQQQQQQNPTGEPADIPRPVIQSTGGCDAWTPYPEDW